MLISGAVLGVVALSTVAADQPAEIVEIRTIERGQPASIRGEVVRIVDYDELVVADSTGRVEVYSEGGFPARLVAVGDMITVEGWADDALFARRREIYADRIIFANGSEYSRTDPTLLDCDDGMQ